jgi:hypothetical protein
MPPGMYPENRLFCARRNTFVGMRRGGEWNIKGGGERECKGCAVCKLGRMYLKNDK